jgi:hypothetical protein
MVFRKPNTKRKYTKRHTNTKRKYTKRRTNAKRKYTKRRTNTKRKYTNRKSKKYGGKCINMTDMTKMNTLIAYLQRMGGLSFRDAKDIVDGMVNSEYMYDCDNILKTLKKAVNAVNNSNLPEETFSKIQDVIFATLNKIQNQAEQLQQSQQPKSIPQKPLETPKEVSNDGCPSDGKEPVNCNERNDYFKQALIFHPDKNPMCKEEATSKFQALQNNPTCKFVTM